MYLLYFNGGKMNSVLLSNASGKFDRNTQPLCVYRSSDYWLLQWRKMKPPKVNREHILPLSQQKGVVVVWHPFSLQKIENKMARWLYCDQIPCADHFQTYIYTCSCKRRSCLTQLHWKENTRAGHLFLFWNISTISQAFLLSSLPMSIYFLLYKSIFIIKKKKKEDRTWDRSFSYW